MLIICAFEIFARVAAIITLRLRFIGRKLIFYKDNEAVCAALTEGAAWNRITLVSIPSPRAIAAGYKITSTVEGPPRKEDLAAAPSRGKPLGLVSQVGPPPPAIA